MTPYSVYAPPAVIYKTAESDLVPAHEPASNGIGSALSSSALFALFPPIGVFNAARRVAQGAPAVIEQGQAIRETATDLTVGSAYRLGNSTGAAAATAGSLGNAVKWGVIGTGVIIGSLVALKTLQTVREVSK